MDTKSERFYFGVYVILIALIKFATGICVGNACLEDMDDTEAADKFEYVLSKYEEIEMSIAGKPIGLRGKRVTHDELVEEHIVFNYIDNTAHDIIQNCVFVISNFPGECESIITACNTYLPRTPRPLLERKPLSVCEGGVSVVEMETTETDETTADPEAEIITDRELVS